MDTNKNIDQQIDSTLNSLDGADQAMPKPFLYTRVMARMNKETNSYWERAGKFIAKPAVLIAGLCLVLSINAAVLFNNTGKSTTAEQTSTDGYSTAVATLYNFENTEQ
jgi:hypothetical protein